MTIGNYVRLQNIRGIGPKKISDILLALLERNQSIDYFFSLSSDELAKQFKLSKTLSDAVVSSPVCDPALLKQLEEKKIRILVYGSNEYPQVLAKTLGKDAPPILYVWGNLDLLNKPAVGFCGSREVTTKGLEVTSDSACQIASKGWVVVSGHARGVDAIAHASAIKCGSATVIVLPQGILDFKMRAEIKSVAIPNQLLVISEFFPTARWSVGNAMTRNKTILGLSDAMVLVESRLEGGTFEAGKSALKWKIPLYVAQYQVAEEHNKGNEYFLKQGALALKKSAKTNKANLSSLVRAVNKRRKDVQSTNEKKNAKSKEVKTLPLFSQSGIS